MFFIYYLFLLTLFIVVLVTTIQEHIQNYEEIRVLVLLDEMWLWIVSIAALMIMGYLFEEYVVYFIIIIFIAVLLVNIARNIRKNEKVRFFALIGESLLYAVVIASVVSVLFLIS